MVAPTTNVTRIDGFGTAGDVSAPVFQVYLGSERDEPAPRANAAILVDRAAVAEIEASIDRRVQRGALKALAGPWADDAGRTNDVVAVVFEESIEGNFPLATLRVTLHNVYDDRSQTYRYTDVRGPGDPLIDYGKTLVLRMGYPYGGSLDRIEPVFEGIIVSIEASFPADGQPTLEVIAADRRDRLRASRKKRGRPFRAGSIEQLIADVAAEYGLRVAVTAAQARDLDDHRPRTRLVKPVHQPPDQDALQFITARAKLHALELTAFGDVVFVQDPGDVTDHALRYVYRAGLISFAPRLNAAGRPTKATVIARDSETGARIEETADAGTLQELKLLPKGSSVLDRIRADGQAGDRELVVTNYAVQSPEECLQVAAGLLKRNLDQTFTATGELVGDPRVRVRTTLDLGGTGRWDGFYYVTMSRHRFGANGYQTTFHARRNLALAAPGDDAEVLA